MAAGKSTLSAKLASDTNTVLIAEDDWLSHLYGDRMVTLKDFVLYSAKLRGVMGPHVQALLGAGVSVVLDFAANTLEQRAWMQTILDGCAADHRLHVLIPPDEVCLARLHTRNASGQHPFAPTEAQFHQFSKHFQRPTAEEGFNLVIHDHA